MKVYIDGTLHGSRNDAGGDPFDPTTKIHIGVKSSLYQYSYYEGDMDDMRIYNRPLPESEIQELYTGSQPELDPTMFVENVEYNAAGQIERIEYGNGVVTTRDYDVMFRLTNIHTEDAQGTVLQDLSYLYDSVGNIIEIIDNVHQSDQTFEYDEVNRLVAADGEIYGPKTYAYDEIGNLIEKDGKTYTYGGGDAGPHAVTSLSDGSTFDYDANGNMTMKYDGTEDKTFYYKYDAENRLIEVKEGVLTVIEQYEYDGDGGRTKKITHNGAQLDTTTYVGSMYEERDGVATKFVFLGDIRVASIKDDQVLYYHQDHLGGTNVISDDQGEKKELIEYEPFGKPHYERFGLNDEDVAWYYFTGKPFDDKTGLYYYGARYYDPSLGRFITADTIVPKPGNPQAYNRYSYAGNNPVTYFEDGNGWFIPFIVAAVKGAAVGAAVGASVAAVTGGNIGQGALFGAIGGAAFAGFGNIAQSLTRIATVPGGVGPLTASASLSADIIGGVFGGAAGGAAVASIAGGDVGQSALIGGLSVGVFAAGKHFAGRASAWLKQDRASANFSESVRNSSTEILKNIPSKVDIVKELNNNKSVFDYVSLSEAFQRSQESIDLFAPVSKVHWNRDWIYHAGSLFGALDVNKINNTMTLGPLVVATISGAGAVASNAGFNYNPASTLLQAFGASGAAAATKLSEATIIATTTYAASAAGGAIVGILGGEIAANLLINPGATGSNVSNFRFTYGINRRFRY